MADPLTEMGAAIIAARGFYPLRDGLAALEEAGRPGVLKVLLDMRN